MMKRMGHLKMKIQSSKLISPYNSRNSLGIEISKQVIRIARSMDFLNQNLKINLREKPRTLDKVATHHLGQSDMDVNGTNT